MGHEGPSIMVEGFPVSTLVYLYKRIDSTLIPAEATKACVLIRAGQYSTYFQRKRTSTPMLPSIEGSCLNVDSHIQNSAVVGAKPWLKSDADDSSLVTNYVSATFAKVEALPSVLRARDSKRSPQRSPGSSNAWLRAAAPPVSGASLVTKQAELVPATKRSMAARSKANPARRGFVTMLRF
jgi:hypothetical protein